MRLLGCSFFLYEESPPLRPCSMRFLDRHTTQAGQAIRTVVVGRLSFVPLMIDGLALLSIRRNGNSQPRAASRSTYPP